MVQPGDSRAGGVSVAETRISWYPLRGKLWSKSSWLGSDTWINGHRLFARMSLGSGIGGPPLLMLHGAVVSGAYFGPIARRLRNSCPMYIPDMAGFGRSESTGMLSLENHVELLDRWMGIHDLRQTVVVANSTGCQVATLLATRYPDRVARMVLVAPTMDPATGGIVGLMWRGLIDIPRERQRLWTIWLPDFFASGPVRAFHSLFEALRDPQPERLGEVRQPSVCVSGERDPICPPRWVKSMAARLPAAQAVVLPGAPHAMNFSSPDALARIILSMVHDGERTGTIEGWH